MHVHKKLFSVECKYSTISSLMSFPKRIPSAIYLNTKKKSIQILLFE